MTAIADDRFTFASMALRQERGAQPQVTSTAEASGDDPGIRRISTRRRFLQRVGLLGMALSLSAVTSLLPRRAWASHDSTDGYNIYGSCPSYAANHDCSPGCGPSTVYGDACIEDTGHVHYRYHKGQMYDANLMLRPNDCLSGGYDGWIWNIVVQNGGCGGCANGQTLVRWCHDGYKRISGSWVPSICRWKHGCIWV